jgi:hypothetical protein
VRRSAVLALAASLATTGALAVDVLPAAAHICPVPAEIAVGQPATIAVGVTVEDTPVADVTITIPAGLQLDRVDAKEGWTITRTGATVRLRGGPIPRFDCRYFSFGVTAPAAGSFGIPVVQRTADGTVVARSIPDPANKQSRTLDQWVYAGVEPPSSSSGSGGTSVTMIAGIVLAALGVVLVAILGVRTWRDRGHPDDDADPDADGDGDGGNEAARDAEVRARLEQFKKRAPNPPPPE